MKLVQLKKPEARYDQMTLEQLFDRAVSYGNIHLYQSDIDRKFSFTIEFESIPGTKLEAKSGHGHTTIQSAIIGAIIKAEKIREQFK